jgi:hypothetical protein
MHSLGLSTRFTLSLALWIFVLAASWLAAVPAALQPSTYVSIAALLTALAAITMKTCMGGQATGRLAAMIHQTASARSTRSGRRPAPGLER